MGDALHTEHIELLPSSKTNHITKPLCLFQGGMCGMEDFCMMLPCRHILSTKGGEGEKIADAWVDYLAEHQQQHVIEFDLIEVDQHVDEIECRR